MPCALFILNYERTKPNVSKILVVFFAMQSSFRLMELIRSYFWSSWPFLFQGLFILLVIAGFIWKRVQTIYILAVLPLLYCAWFYLYVLRQRIHLGYWPKPSRPDPKDAGYVWHHLSIYVGMDLIPVCIIAFLISMAIVIYKNRNFRWYLPVGIMAMGMTIIAVQVTLDPWHLLSWFFD